MTPNVMFNAGSIHDFPIGKGVSLAIGKRRFAIFRETYGHFYAFADDRSDAERDLHNGVIRDGKLILPNGHFVDLHTGQVDHSTRLLRSVLSWVENGFIFLSISTLLLM